MHTTRLSNGRAFLHNGDFSGSLYINLAPGEAESIAGANGPVVRATIPFADIKEIVARADHAEAGEDLRALASGLLEIAEQAMPSTFFASDSRCQLARAVLERLGEPDAT